VQQHILRVSAVLQLEQLVSDMKQLTQLTSTAYIATTQQLTSEGFQQTATQQCQQLIQMLTMQQLIQRCTASRQRTIVQRARLVSATEQFTEFNSIVGPYSVPLQFMQLAPQLPMQIVLQQLMQLTPRHRQSADLEQPAQVSTAPQRSARRSDKHLVASESAHAATSKSVSATQRLDGTIVCSQCKSQGGEIAGTQLGYEPPLQQLQHLTSQQLQQLAESNVNHSTQLTLMAP
jgi:hypothetical protein